jgi:hypothetical protein
MNTAVSDWIDAWPQELSGQQALLRRLVSACEASDSIRWLVVACSVGRGAADRYSDLDLGMGIKDQVFEAALSEVRQVIDGLAELVDSYQHQLKGLAMRHERIFAQYADRCQIDLVVIPASQSVGPVRDEVVLYNQGEHEVVAFEQQTLTPEKLREWAFRISSPPACSRRHASLPGS